VFELLNESVHTVCYECILSLTLLYIHSQCVHISSSPIHHYTHIQ